MIHGVHNAITIALRSRIVLPPTYQPLGIYIPLSSIIDAYAWIQF